MNRYPFGKNWPRSLCGFLVYSAVFMAGDAVFSQMYHEENWYAETPPAQRADSGTRVSDVLSIRTPARDASIPTAPAARVHSGGVSQAGYNAPVSAGGAGNAAAAHVTPASHQEPVRTTPATHPSVETAMRSMPAELSPAPGEGMPKNHMPASADGLIAFQEVLATPTGKVQQLTIIDPKQRSICVYHVDMSTGQIELRSARDIQWDLQMNNLNSKKPLPHEVRGILQGAKN